MDNEDLEFRKKLLEIKQKEVKIAFWFGVVGVVIFSGFALYCIIGAILATRAV